MERMEWLTVGEVAERLKVSEETVRRWLRAGRLNGTLLSRKAGYRVRADEVERFLAGDAGVMTEEGETR